MKQNVASQIIGVQMVSATDGSAFTGAVSASVTVDGGVQGAGGGTVTHEGNGFHTYTITQAETNGAHVAVTFTGTGAVPRTVQAWTTFPQTGDSFARVGAPAGASVSADIAAVKVDTAAILVDTGTTLDARIPAALVGGRMDANVGAISSDSVAADNAEAFFDGTGYAGTNNVIPTVTTTGTATAVTTVNGLAAGVITAASIAADAITAAKIADGAIDAATFAAGAINAAAIAADAITDAKVAADVTIASVTGAVGSVTGAVGSVTGNVGGNVVGSVGSVVGSVGSVTGAVGSVTGAVGSVTGNVGGNVVGSVGSVTAEVNANVQKINDVALVGDGSITPWGP